MICDYTIPKPESLGLYAVHRFVAQLCDGVPYLFVDRGDRVVIRTTKFLCDRVTEVSVPSLGDVIAFSLRSAVSKRVKGKNAYAPLSDWRARHQWLEKRSEKNGFALLALHTTSKSVKVEREEGQFFQMDSTDFTGVLKVTDEPLFAACLTRGIGRVGKPYGMGMLVI
jgi:hypothetical protein